MKLNSIHKQLIRSGLENESTLLSYQLEDLVRLLEFNRYNRLLKLDTAALIATAGALERFAKQLNAVRKDV